jgi:hypothetical protein
MARSEVSICNVALGRLAISNEIASLTEQSNEAVQCRRFYETTRDRVLTEAPWNFASRRSSLANVGTPPDGWGYRYRYPNDCLQARKIINPASRSPAADQRIPFAVMEDQDNAGKVIVTDEANAVLEYTLRVTDTTLFSPGFDSALAWALAAEIGGPLKADVKWIQLAEQRYAMALMQAWANSANEGQEDTAQDSEFVRARG